MKCECYLRFKYIIYNFPFLFSFIKIFLNKKVYLLFSLMKANKIEIITII